MSIIGHQQSLSVPLRANYGVSRMKGSEFVGNREAVLPMFTLRTAHSVPSRLNFTSSRPHPPPRHMALCTRRGESQSLLNQPSKLTALDLSLATSSGLSPKVPSLKWQTHPHSPSHSQSASVPSHYKSFHLLSTPGQSSFICASAASGPQGPRAAATNVSTAAAAAAAAGGATLQRPVAFVPGDQGKQKPPAGEPPPPPPPPPPRPASTRQNTPSPFPSGTSSGTPSVSSSAAVPIQPNDQSSFSSPPSSSSPSTIHSDASPRQPPSSSTSVLTTGAPAASPAGSKARPRVLNFTDSDLHPHRALPLPMTTPTAKPLSPEEVAELMRCNPDIQDCKETVYQWTSKCSKCLGSGYSGYTSYSSSSRGRKGGWGKKGKSSDIKCISCCGIGYVYRYTVRDDIPIMEDVDREGF